MIGTEIDGRYRILSKLDEGGMGEVYLAEHIHLGRKEALKFLLPALAADDELASRFRREARAMNRLSHPNIVSVYDFGRAPDGRFYLAVEYAPGQTLASVLALEGALPMARAASILGQLAEAVAHAHARGVVHRDLKPANLVLVAAHDKASEVVKVLDFGLAKIVADDEPSTSTGGDGLRGTVGYMAPELFRGEPASPASDVYALGCLAWEALTGRPPFLGRASDVMEMHLHEAPSSPSDHRITGAVPPALERLVLACLAKDPARRPAPAQLIEVLANLATDRMDPRRSYRKIAVMPRAPDLDDFVEDDDTQISDRHDTALDAGHARTMVLPIGEAVGRYHEALRELAEAVLDRGGGDLGLGVALTGLGRLERERDRFAGEMADLEAERSNAERRAREHEGRLRFAMGDLRFLRDERSGATREFDDQLGVLGGELIKVLGETERTLATITERQLEIASEDAANEEALLAQCRALDPLVDAAAHGPDLGVLRERVAEARLLVKMALR